MKLQVEVYEKCKGIIDTNEVAEKLGRKRLTAKQVQKLLSENGPFFGDSDWSLHDFDHFASYETVYAHVKKVR